MKSNKTYDTWILKGYDFFAETGPVRFSIRELSKRIGLSRTSFNYHFGNKQYYFENLLQFHLDRVTEFNQIVRQQKNLEMEDFMKFMDDYAVIARFQLRLFNHRHTDQFDKAYVQGLEINIRYGLLQWLTNILGLNGIAEDKAKRAYFLFTDTFFARCNLVDQTPRLNLKFSDVFYQTVEDIKGLVGK